MPRSRAGGPPYLIVPKADTQALLEVDPNGIGTWYLVLRDIFWAQRGNGPVLLPAVPRRALQALVTSGRIQVEGRYFVDPIQAARDEAEAARPRTEGGTYAGTTAGTESGTTPGTTGGTTSEKGVGSRDIQRRTSPTGSDDAGATEGPERPDPDEVAATEYATEVAADRLRAEMERLRALG